MKLNNRQDQEYGGKYESSSWVGNARGTIHPPQGFSPKEDVICRAWILCEMGTILSQMKLLNHPPSMPISPTLYNPTRQRKVHFQTSKHRLKFDTRGKPVEGERAKVISLRPLPAVQGFLLCSYDRVQSTRVLLVLKRYKFTVPPDGQPRA